jgi:hypothetical protein
MINVFEIHMGKALDMPISFIADNDERLPKDHIIPATKPGMDKLKGKLKNTDIKTVDIKIPKHIKN